MYSEKVAYLYMSYTYISSRCNHYLLFLWARLHEQVRTDRAKWSYSVPHRLQVFWQFSLYHQRTSILLKCNISMSYFSKFFFLVSHTALSCRKFSGLIWFIDRNTLVQLVLQSESQKKWIPVQKSLFREIWAQDGKIWDKIATEKRKAGSLLTLGFCTTGKREKQ